MKNSASLARRLLAVAGLLSAATAFAGMITPWTAKVDRSAPLPEYPRPQLAARELDQPQRTMGLRNPLARCRGAHAL
jgi:hypothetical protein